MIRLKIKTNYNEKVLSLLKNQLSHKWSLYKVMLSREALNIYYHDKSLGRISNPKIIRRELNELTDLNSSEGIYKFKQTKESVREISERVQIINNRQNELEQKLPDKLHQFIDLNLLKRMKVIFYPMGTDGGFVLLPKTIYLNSRHLSSDYEGFVDLLAHEIYHARSRSITKYFKFFVNKTISKDKFYHKQFGSILEEGVASLIELGVSYNYRSNSAITPNELSKTEDYFRVLNSQLKNKEFYNDSIKNLLNEFDLNIYNLCYVVGYHIAKTVYEHSGIEGINSWSIEHNYKKAMTTYIEACKMKKRSSFFDMDIEMFLST